MSAASEEARALLADERAEEQHGGMSLGAFRVGGIIERLCEEVERLEKHEALCAGVHASPIFVDKTGTLLETTAENARLREALEAAKFMVPPWTSAERDEHNARIDAALRGPT